MSDPQDRPAAQYHLGRMYELGHGVQPDLTTALQWYRKAADQGEQRARDRVVYLQGRKTAHT